MSNRFGSQVSYFYFDERQGFGPRFTTICSTEEGLEKYVNYIPDFVVSVRKR